MKIEIEPKDIKYKIQVGEGKFEDMAGSLIRIKGHEVGVGPSEIKGTIYIVMTDLRTGIALYKFPMNTVDRMLASTRELTLEIYEIKINLLNEEVYDYIFKKADYSLDKYAKAPAYELLEEME